MPVGFPIMDFYSEFATYGDYAISVANNSVNMHDLPRDSDGGWKGRKAGLEAYATKIMAEVDPAEYNDLDGLIYAMLEVERPEFNYA